jgi:transcriptional regulator with XRE-family HTH domain
MELGMKIRTKREQVGFSQQELARRVGMTQARISELECGERTQMSLQHLRNMARALGVSADYLLGTWDEDAVPVPPAAPPEPPPPPGGRRRGRPRKTARVAPAGATG